MDCRIFTLAVVLLLTACVVENTEPKQEAQPIVETEGAPQAPTPPQPVRWECDEPRPTRCTTQTASVCGSNSATYRNDCYACRDIAVAWYTEGDCV